jgi:hypothetical protein
LVGRRKLLVFAKGTLPVEILSLSFDPTMDATQRSWASVKDLRFSWQAPRKTGSAITTWGTFNRSVPALALRGSIRKVVSKTHLEGSD